MSYGSQKLFGSRFSVSSEMADRGVSVFSKFPLLITPESILWPARTATTNANQEIRNLGSSHYMRFYETTGNIDLLHGAVFTTKERTHGLTFGLDETGGSATLKNYWICGNGAGGTSGAVPTVTAATLGTQTGNSGSALITTLPTANFMMFIIAEIDSGAIQSATSYKSCGFDLMGWKQDTTSTGPAIGCILGDGSGGWGCGASNSFTAPNIWDSAYAPMPTPAVSGGGVIATVVAVNGTSGVVRARGLNGAIATNVGTTDTPSATSWTSAWGTPTCISLDLGDGSADGSDKIGFYAMGIRNYSAPITEHEVGLTAQFMSRTGTLPPWWTLSA